jgi:hypothetical protein
LEFTNTGAEGTWFDNNYHREMFEDDIDAILKLKDNPGQENAFY